MSCCDEKMDHTVDFLLPRVQQSLVLAKINVDLTRKAAQAVSSLQLLFIWRTIPVGGGNISSLD